MTDRLRAARRDEVGALNRLIAASARALSRGYYTPSQIEALIEQVFGVDTQLLEDRTYYVIERDGALLACGGWSHRRTLFGGDQAKGATDADLDPRTEAARIRAFFVHPTAARQGLGRRLLAHCESEARRAGFRRAELMATLPGEPLYRAAGYEPLERVEHALSGCEAAAFVRMGRALGGPDRSWARFPGTLARAITYASLFVGFLLVFLPARLLEWSGIESPAAIALPQAAGLVVGGAGALVALACIVTFAREGKGTPAPFDPPRRLVSTGPYRHVRNPMYLGAGLALLGAASYYRSPALLAYVAAFMLSAHLFVVWYEEPTLRRLFGPAYEAYCERAGRWWPARARK